jgi:hypothetical protein
MKTGIPKDDIRSLAAQVFKRIGDLRAERSELERRRDALKAQLDELRALPVPLEDFKGFLIEYVHAKRAEFRALLRSEVEQLMIPHRYADMTPVHLRDPVSFAEMEAMLQAGGEKHITEQGRVLRLLQPVPGAVGDLGFYFVFADQIAAAIDAEWDSLGVQWPSPPKRIGSNRASRRVEIAEVMAEIAKVEDLIAEANGEIRDLGGES